MIWLATNANLRCFSPSESNLLLRLVFPASQGWGMKSNPNYYAERLRAEHEAAAAATCEQARAAHLVLAGEYERKLAAKNGLRLVSDPDLAGGADPRPVAEA